MPNSGPLFDVHDVWLDYRRENGQRQTVLQGATVTIHGGAITCLVGSSGSGKSSLLRLLNRLEEPGRGQIDFCGRALPDLDPLDLRRRVALVPQTPTMLPGTVLDNLEAGARLRGRRLEDPGAWLGRVGLTGDFVTKQARDLSGGEKQRVALIRTLATQPEVLLLDEVTSSLDPDSEALVEQLLVSLNLPVVWVSHDADQVRRVAAHVLRLENGQIREVAVQ